MDGCANNSESFSTRKIGEHIPCGYSMPKIWVFDHIENRPILYSGWKWKRLNEKVLWIFNRTRKI